MGIAGRVLQRFGLSRSLPASRAAPPAPPVADPGPLPRPLAIVPITFADLSETPDPALIPPLDRPDADTAHLTPEQRAWRERGVVILRRFLPDDVLDPYIARRALPQFERPDHFPFGWYSPTPYEHVPELRRAALYPPLMRMLAHLIGEDMFLHLSLTGWVSTERNWHQDDYLNPAFVNGWYAAVWIALDTISAEAGPFEYVPGSHRWPLLRQDKVRGCMTEAEANARDPVSNQTLWPKTSERFVVPAIEAEIATRGATIEPFIAEKGDVLIWHGRLMHRGSLPVRRDLLRPALIAHYSGLTHRPDMQHAIAEEDGMRYFVPNIPLW